MIELRGVAKRYHKLEQDAMLLKSVLPWTRPKRTELWALRDLNFTVEPGELVGVIGHNGAGKTTLLRLLAGVTSPTRGDVRVTGRIAPLISIGVGFHPEMTGRENVLINGMLLGLRVREVAERFDSIVDFAEMWEFIDTPVKFYSSGMTLRLAFGVIVHIDPTILLVDEILAVGDASFQLKCYDRLRQFQDDGAAILMVSHALHQIRALCERAILIRHGVVEYDGEPEGAIDLHQTLGDSVTGTSANDIGAVQILQSCLVRANGGDQPVDYGEPLELALRLRFTRTVVDPQIVIGVFTGERTFGGVNATEPGVVWRTFREGEECEVHVSFDVRLAGGNYILKTQVKERDGGRVLGSLEGPRLTVAPRDGISGLVDLAPRLTLERL